LKGNKRVRQNRFKAETAKVRKWPEFMTVLDFLVRTTLALALVLTAGLVFIFVHDLAVQSDYFRVPALEVGGNQRLSREEILEWAGVADGVNSLSVNLSLMRKRLMAHPWINDVSVQRRIPAGIVIQVREETPLARVEMGGAREILVNRQGLPFKEKEPLDGDEVEALCRVRGLELVQGRDGLGFGGPLFDQAMTLLHMTELKPIRSIALDPDLGVFMDTTDPCPGETGEGDATLTLRLGVGRFQEKIGRSREILRYVRDHFPGQRIGVMDLGDPSSVTVTLEACNPLPDGTKGGV
jgi:cell division protein FtsQ